MLSRFYNDHVILSLLHKKINISISYYSLLTTWQFKITDQLTEYLKLGLAKRMVISF